MCMFPNRATIYFRAYLLAVSAIALTVLTGPAAQAKLFQSHPVAAAEEVLVEPLPPEVVTDQAIAVCCAKPCIKYKYHRRCRKVCCTAEPPIKMVLLVKNPADCEGCHVEIPVCIPGCCTDVPCVRDRCGIFHRGIVTYDYASGFRIKVIFRARGDIVVRYYGS